MSLLYAPQLHAMQALNNKPGIRTLPGAAVLLQRVCFLYRRSPRLMQFCHHALSGRVVVESVQATLPFYRGLQVRRRTPLC